MLPADCDPWPCSFGSSAALVTPKRCAWAVRLLGAVFDFGHAAPNPIDCGTGMATGPDFYITTFDTGGRPHPWRWELRRRSSPMGVIVGRSGYRSQTAALLWFVVGSVIGWFVDLPSREPSEGEPCGPGYKWTRADPGNDPDLSCEKE